MYSATSVNRSCSKAETLLRRTDTFDLVCFLYASLSHISKAETVKRTLLWTDNFFQSSDEKATCLNLDAKNIFRNSEKQRIKLDIFVNFLKNEHFLHFKTTDSFLLHFTVLREYDTFDSNSVSFLQFALCNQPIAVLRYWKWYRTRTFRPYSTLLWTIAFTTVTDIET